MHCGFATKGHLLYNLWASCLKKLLFEMDMGKVRPLGGVRTKGRGDANQWVTAFQAFVSVDHKSWYAVENGKEYNGNHDNKHNQDTVFARILNARYVRLQISSWHSHLSMRAAPLIEN
jgi:hypothetical protein